MGDRSYGVPYKGSKNKFADKIIDAIPPAPVFVDMFAGGCAVTHAAMLSGKFGTVVANDLDFGGAELFQSAMSGRVDTERFVSREEFQRLKDADPYIRFCWSFGGEGDNYFAGRHIEPLIKAQWDALRTGDCSCLRGMGLPIPDGADLKTMQKTAAAYSEAYAEWFAHSDALRGIFENEPNDSLRHSVGALLAMSKEELSRRKAEYSEKLRRMLREALVKSGARQAELYPLLGNFMCRHYFGASQWEFPTPENYEKLRTRLTSLPPLEELQGELEEARVFVSVCNLLKQTLDNLRKVTGRDGTRDIMQRLRRVKSLAELDGRVARPRFIKSDYSSVMVSTPDAVIYCDPPYKGTSGYICDGTPHNFDHERFYDWCERQKHLVIISEFEMPSDRFSVVFEFQRTCSFSSTSRSKVTERLFVPKAQKNEYYRRLNDGRELNLFEWADMVGAAAAM